MKDLSTQTNADRIDKFTDDEYLSRGPFSGKNHLVYQIDAPALRVAGYHDRIMGFWVITWIHLVKEELRNFFENGGLMRLIIGIPSSERSYSALMEAALSAGNDNLADYMRNQFLDKLRNPVAWTATEASELFVEAVAAGKIIIKIRPGESPDNKLTNKPEHSKLRIFKLKEHTYTVAGSANDTLAAWTSEKEFTGVASVTWSPDKAVANGAIKAQEVFEDRWNDELSYPLDEKCILVLEDLKKTYLSDSRFEKDILIEEFEGTESFLLNNQKPTILCFEPDIKFIRNTISNPPLKIGSEPDINIIRIGDDSTHLLLLVLLCDKYNIPYTLFVDDNISKDLEMAQEGQPIAGKSKFDLIKFAKDKYGPLINNDDDAVYIGILENIGFDLSPEMQMLNDAGETNPEGNFWNPAIYSYPYNETPGDLSMRDHQKNALTLWIENGYRGIFQHATGTYKTATGLSSAAHLLSKEDCNLVILSSPYKSVSEQWDRLSRKCFRGGGVIVLGCWSDKGDWRPSFRRCMNLAMEKGKKVLAIFVNNSLWGLSQKHNYVQEQLNIYKTIGEWGLIADEMHNWIGSPTGPANAFIDSNSDCNYRLGLTAKIDKMGKEDTPQNLKLKQWFAQGKELCIDDFKLDRAISEGFLRSYNYELKVIQIIADDTKASVHGVKYEFENSLSKFKLECENYTAENSYKIMEEKEAKRMLIYTGPTLKDVDYVIGMLSDQRSVMDLGEIRRFTSRESSRERESIIEDFNAGDSKILVAIKCLDEGVNIPVADTAILIESDITDDRQWIQRRGRILRKIGDDDPPANIIDFFPHFITNNSDLRVMFDILEEDYFERVLEFSGSSTISSQQNLRTELRKAK